MPNDEHKRSVPSLKAVGNKPNGAAQNSEPTALALEEIRVALTPILGPVGVAALYWRCLRLCSDIHPCFGSLHDSEQTAMNTSSLQMMLAQRSSGEACEMGDALINTFYTLLATLIGPALTEQLVGDCMASFMDRNDHQSNDT